MLLLCKEHKTELHELEQTFKMKFLEEMSGVAEAVFNAFHPSKLNYELIRNGVPLLNKVIHGHQKYEKTFLYIIS